MTLPALSIDLGTLAALAALASVLISSFKPVLELLPFAKPSSPAHDSVIRLANLLVSLVLVLGVAASTGHLSGASVFPLIIQVLATVFGAQGIYSANTRLGSSVGGASVTASPPLVATLSAPAIDMNSIAAQAVAAAQSVLSQQQPAAPAVPPSNSPAA